MNILGWTHWHIVFVEENTHDFQITAEQEAVVSCCPHCTSSLLYRHGTKPQLFMDIPIRGKRAGINVIRRRYQCRKCRKTFLEPLHDMNDHHSMTKRLVLYVARESLRRTFTSVADDVGIDERTVRRIFAESTKSSEAKPHTHSPAIGIDEVHLLHKPRCVITDIDNRRIIDLLRNRNKTTVINFLCRLPGRDSIQTVCMDMWTPYRDAVQMVMPQAQVIIDKFHVVKMVNEALETVRKSIRESLTDRQRRTLMHDRYILLHRYSDLDESKRLTLAAWTENFPDLKAAYWLKESFFDIWTASNSNQAETLYQDWQKRIPPHLGTAFQPLLTAMANWRPEILAYFDHSPLTNAYTEALNGLVKTANRLGRGYSFEVLRAKILETGGLQRVERPAYGEQWIAHATTTSTGSK